MTESDPTVLEALERVRALVEEATHHGEREPLSAALATAASCGHVSIRTIYVTSIDEDGFVFFARRESGKGRQILSNPRAALCFFWPALQQQITVEGVVEILNARQSEQLWNTRPPDARLAPWASSQGAPMHERNTLQESLDCYRRKFGNNEVPRPPGWSAFRLHPDRLQFWETGWDRLNERISYERQATGGWNVTALQP